MTITILYFARLKEALGTAIEQVDYAANTATVGGVCTLLAARGDVWAYEFAVGRAVRAAVNQELANMDTLVKEGDEVAFFPPVTGG
jgi:sulfur-carrier protein